jgi:hypothetical protein
VIAKIREKSKLYILLHLGEWFEKNHLLFYL